MRQERECEREREREGEKERKRERTRGRERKTGPERERRRDCTLAEATIGTRPGSDRATTTGNDVAIETRAHRWPLAEGHRQTPLRDRDLTHQAREAPGTRVPAQQPPQLAILQLVLSSYRGRRTAKRSLVQPTHAEGCHTGPLPPPPAHTPACRPMEGHTSPTVKSKFLVFLL